MKLAKNTDFVLTILFLLLALASLVLAVIFTVGVDFLFESGGAFAGEHVDSESVTAGYELLIHVFGGFAGIFVGIMGKIVGMCFGLIGCVFTIITILHFVRRKKYQETGESKYLRKNLISKMVWNSILLVVAVLALINEIGVAIFIFILVLGALEVFLIKLIQSI